MGRAERRRLLGYARKLTDDRVVRWCGPEDLVQEALTDAYSNLGHYHGETEADFHTWVLGILKKKVQAARRAQAKAGRLEKRGATSVVLDASVEVELETAELRRCVGRVTMQTLNEADRTVVELVFSQGLKYTQAARRLNLSTSTFCRRLARILTKLEPRLRPYR